LKSDHAHHVFDPDLSWQQYKNTLKFQYKLASIFRKKILTLMLILNIVGRLENNQGQQYFQEVLEIIKIS